jgi:hypothetical protein
VRDLRLERVLAIGAANCTNPPRRGQMGLFGASVQAKKRAG